MAKIYRFRALVDYDLDVFRDIEIRTDQHFEDLHLAIQESFGFDNSQMASFYMSNEDWDKGAEIALFDMRDEGQTSELMLMKETSLESQVTEENQKILYVFDFLLMWCFYVELIRTEPAQEGVDYPQVVTAYGDAPDQYSKAPDIDLSAFDDLDLSDMDEWSPESDNPPSADQAYD